MKTLVITLALAVGFYSCQNSGSSESSTSAASTTQVGGQEAVQDDVSDPDVVKVAVGSPDHTTLVTAIKAADLTTSLANAGPFTVFAPTNAAFDALPHGTVESLLQPENKSQLENILQHHVMTSALSADFFQDGQTMGMVDGTNVTFTVNGDEVLVDGAKILGSVKASNGWVHVVDKVIIPQ
ncbi:fasciclin domain-containing protein [Jiulongibacter sediminis]|uniref:Fasciclin n=1 Tax=Jiulongibacter sediminis TaxID=1605367 RepID=A0A0P7BI74_9BACT|nr:fasciclin domain-containing protein [Jiulongibacter sediminis]KPM46789.1 fasciclin [Jiulongibacter sediminis]TBX21693.1 fasciclin [Jiulongibacter sediminis]